MVDGTFRSREARHGARLPFDFLLHSLADECGPRAIGVILSGTGADGSLGLKAIKASGGFVIAQSPDEADFDGMPLSAIATGAVDRVLAIADIPSALIEHNQKRAPGKRRDGRPDSQASPDWLAKIIDLIRTKTAHDFRLYKHGTLRRRIERRLDLRGFKVDGADRYLELLQSDPAELDSAREGHSDQRHEFLSRRRCLRSAG